MIRQSSLKRLYLLLSDDVPEKVTSTPLLDYLRKRREEKKRIREEKKEERKKRELERRKVKDEQRKAKKVASTVSTSVTASVPSDTYEPVETSAMVKEFLYLIIIRISKIMIVLYLCAHQCVNSSKFWVFNVLPNRWLNLFFQGFFICRFKCSV